MALGGRYLGGYMGGRLEGDEDLHLQDTEYIHIIHCDLNYSGPFNGGRYEEVILGTLEVVVAGGIGFFGSARG